MTVWPNFTDPQFMDANGTGGLNAAFGSVSGAVAAVGSGAWAAPGLLAPEAMTVSFSGMTATVGLPRPWGLVASSGTVVRAHGVQTNQDTTTYSVGFASLVPSSGSLTAYLAATVTQIQQNPFPIPGPPQGDPAYNPNYVPTVGYATNLYSVALSAVSGGVDNASAFELLRTTLVAGQVAVSGWSTAGQVRAGNRKAWPGGLLFSGGVLTPAQAQQVISPAVSGLTFTVPPVSGCGGLTYMFANATNGQTTLATTGADQFFGFAAGGESSFTIPSSGTVEIWGNASGACWMVVSASPLNFLTPSQAAATYATIAELNAETARAEAAEAAAAAWQNFSMGAFSDFGTGTSITATENFTPPVNGKILLNANAGGTGVILSLTLTGTGFTEESGSASNFGQTSVGMYTAVLDVTGGIEATINVSVGTSVSGAIGVAANYFFMPSYP